MQKSMRNLNGGLKKNRLIAEKDRSRVENFVSRKWLSDSATDGRKTGIMTVDRQLVSLDNNKICYSPQLRMFLLLTML